MFAQDLVRKSGEPISYAMWELHLSVEKTLKGLLSATGVPYSKSHDLAYLYRLLGDQHANISHVSRVLPDHKELMQYRYNEKSIMDINRLNQCYLEVVQFIEALVNSAPSILPSPGTLRCEVKLSYSWTENERSRELPEGLQ
jgi:HEPN domain-containing protein